MKVLCKPKLFRISTVAISLDYLIRGQLNYLQNFFDVTAISGLDKHLKTVSLREGVRIIDVPISRSIHLLKDFVSLWKLYKLFHNEQPEIIHSMTPKAGLLSMIAGFLAGVPIRIHTFTGLIFPSRKGFLRWLLKNMDRLTCAFATHIVPEGEGVKHDLIRCQITYKPLKVIGNGNVNGIDTIHFSRSAINEEVLQKVRRTYQIKSNDFVFIFVGRLVKDKGINELVYTFDSIIKRYPQTKLLLVGDYEHKLDPLSTHTLDVIKNHPNIIHAGFQSDVRPFLAVANVLVFPSYREGFPNVPIQAGAMGLPCIVTDINGCNEIIQNNVNGIIIPPRNASKLEKAMLELYENEKKLTQLAQNARPLIVARYEQQMLWQLIKQEYDEQLKKANIIS